MLWWGGLPKEITWKTSVYGRTILKWIFKNCFGDIDWIDVTEDRDRCRAVVNAVMNLRFPYNAESFLNISGLVRFSERNLLHAVSWLVSTDDGFLYLSRNMLH